MSSSIQHHHNLLHSPFYALWISHSSIYLIEQKCRLCACFAMIVDVPKKKFDIQSRLFTETTECKNGKTKEREREKGIEDEYNRALRFKDSARNYLQLTPALRYGTEFLYTHIHTHDTTTSIFQSTISNRLFRKTSMEKWFIIAWICYRIC